MLLAPEIAPSRRKSALRLIWVRRNFVTGITLLVILLGSLIASFHPVRYTATATLSLTPSKSVAEWPAPKKITNMIISIVHSDNFLLPLIEKHQWHQRAAFNPSLNPQETTYSRILQTFEQAKAAPLNLKIAEKIKRDTAIKVKQDFTVQIAFTSATPDLAPKVANAMTEKLAAQELLLGSMKIRQLAAQPESFSEPQISATLGFSGLLGIFTGIALAYLMALTQTKKQEAAYVR
jgi:uncharacterized protein involved in exopolysaccharide biosynthesis